MHILDSALHALYERIAEDGGINWKSSETGLFSWYYAERGLYLLKENSSSALHLVKAHNPIDAMMKVSIKIKSGLL